MNTNLTPIEEVRAIALDFASKLQDYNSPDADKLIADAIKVESYLREGDAVRGA